MPNARAGNSGGRLGHLEGEDFQMKNSLVTARHAVNSQTGIRAQPADAGHNDAMQCVAGQRTTNHHDSRTGLLPELTPTDTDINQP